ncbi:MAG TPA: type VI secretion system baseplate subunit TssF [Caulobacteraceae bacterium]
MDPRLLRAYNEELTYLRETAREFGEENEVVAGRLGLKNPTDPDPYVERLLEGVAFLGARVKLKLEDQFPDFTQHLLHAIQPHYLAPTPSMCVAAFEPQEGDQTLVEGFEMPRLNELTAVAKEQNGATVTFRTGQDVTLWPLKIVETEYLPSRAAVAAFAEAAGVRAEAGLRVRFASIGGAPLAKVAPPLLPIFLAGSETLPGELYRQIVGETLAVIGRSAGSAAGKAGWIPLPPPEQYGFDDDCALLPAEGRSFSGYRLLSEYFACPERFLFFALRDLEKAFSTSQDACDVVFLFSRSAASLSGAVKPANLRLFATPAVNLFEKQLGRVQIKPYDHEFQLVPDRTRPLDFEVWSVTEIVAYSRSNTDPRPVAPLYAFGALLYDWREALFYVPRLSQRRLSTKEQRLRRRSDYLGTETWISLTSPGDAGRLDDVHELAVRALVTNRELPELLRFGGASDLSHAGGPVRAVSVLRAPTRPQPPLGLHDGAWRVIGHLTPNYATLASEDDDDPSLLRDHLALYGRADDPVMRRQIDGILSVRSQPVTRRVPGQDRLAFARGIRIRIKLDDASFEAARMYLFAAVIERFLAEFASVNSFTECVFESQREGVFAQWPPRMGQRRNI